MPGPERVPGIFLFPGMRPVRFTLCSGYSIIDIIGILAYCDHFRENRAGFAPLCPILVIPEEMS